MKKLLLEREKYCIPWCILQTISRDILEYSVPKHHHPPNKVLTYQETNINMADNNNRMYNTWKIFGKEEMYIDRPLINKLKQPEDGGRGHATCHAQRAVWIATWQR